jgi:hypothetical protein
MFQGHCIGITTQVKENTTPYFIGVHCMAHQTNLTIITLLKMPFVFHIEAMLYSLYAFFVHSLKKYLEFVKLAKTFATIG